MKDYRDLVDCSYCYKLFDECWACGEVVDCEHTCPNCGTPRAAEEEVYLEYCGNHGITPEVEGE